MDDGRKPGGFRVVFVGMDKTSFPTKISEMQPVFQLPAPAKKERNKKHEVRRNASPPPPPRPAGERYRRRRKTAFDRYDTVSMAICASHHGVTRRSARASRGGDSPEKAAKRAIPRSGQRTGAVHLPLADGVIHDHGPEGSLSPRRR